jgi:flagellar biosynthesis protein
MSEKTEQPVAIALAYEHGGVPVVTAKGHGAVAEKIVQIAEANGVPMEENPALAAALSAVELDSEIPLELYRAVATVIAYALQVTGSSPRPADGAEG